jgi:hypothetical protein
MASYELANELHEITLSIKLADDSPSMKDAYGLKFKPLRLSVLWAKENAGAWETLHVRVLGKHITKDDEIGTRSASLTFWGFLHAPDWVREILTDTRPVEVMRASHS